jgi:hypothetical protein
VIDRRSSRRLQPGRSGEPSQAQPVRAVPSHIAYAIYALSAL